MAGLAAIEIVQKVSKAWRSLQAGWKHSNRSSKNGKRVRRRVSMASQNRRGADCSTSRSSETSASYCITEDRSSSRLMMSWQDVYEEFDSAFGSHTPMVLGQAQVVRYFPNHERTLDIAFGQLHFLEHNLHFLDISTFIYGNFMYIAILTYHLQIVHAKSCDDLYELVGEDFWLATWCNGTAVEGKRLEGTRITLVKMGQRGYEFAIRTPYTPSRWEEFDAEMTMAWEVQFHATLKQHCGSWLRYFAWIVSCC
ncbi:suppressor of RPS4-RLD 1-like [Durio zibethinus]|uniref:Suppressor of RPS4-RLD 1-like n=1 Tax=Durio zibethinus TaxID=66656 RepID=A0A6P6BAK0_DURZI|nr:suppressor of RPS4-RLD 1-like [Durio zibethinus]